MKGKRLPDEPEACWTERDMAGGKEVKALVAILRTNGCCWAKAGSGGCTMCGYRTASLNNVTEDDLNAQLDRVLEKFDGQDFVKIYTSGSFLDTDEIPMGIRDRVYDEFGKCQRLLFESRPEFVTKDSVSAMPACTTVALGLESSDEDVLVRGINKGFTAARSREAGMLLRDSGIGVRTYLLLKPPYLGERAAIDDAVSSARFADPFSDEISVNPLNVQKATVAERLWKRGEFRSPWIWSLIEVLRTLSGTVSARLMSSPSGGGSQRGVHNCGRCDQAALDAVERFSFSQDPRDLEVSCECQISWKRYMESELMLGTAADIGRQFDSDLTMRI